MEYTEMTFEVQYMNNKPETMSGALLQEKYWSNFSDAFLNQIKKLKVGEDMYLNECRLIIKRSK